MTHDRCRDLTEKLRKYYSAPHSNLRASSRRTDHRIFAEKAAGSRFWDADGNEYIDYLGAMGPNILGHRHPEYVQDLKNFREVTLIHFETLVGNRCCLLPKPGFLENIRAPGDRYGIVTSIDEVITAFWLGLDSARGISG